MATGPTKDTQFLSKLSKY